MENGSTIDVIVPVRNESANLPIFWERLCRVPLPLHAIFVDNASMDGTAEFIRSLDGVTLIRHPEDEGYGGSILDGIRSATASRLVVIDADCEYPPEQIPDLVASLASHPVVYGSRFLGGHPPSMPRVRRVGNRTITGLFNVLFDQDLTDLYTGFKAFRRKTVKNLPLSRKGFEHVLELASRLAQKGVRIHEVPIAYTPRSKGDSKMNHAVETLKFVSLLTAYRLSSSRRRDM